MTSTLKTAAPRSGGPALADAKPRAAMPESPCKACAARHLAVCGVLSSDELYQLTTILNTVVLKPGEQLLFEGDPAKYVFNVTAGTLKLYKLLADGRCQVTGFLYPGDFLGIANREIYVSSAEAVVATSLCRFRKDQLDEMLKRFPHMEQRMMTMAADELAAAQDQMLLLGRKSAKEKIASFLLVLARKAAQRGEQETTLHVPMSRADMGDYLGLTTETVSRCFTQLKTERLISIRTGGYVELLDREALEDLAEGI
ncbi:MAG: helix-turn-helix domain-containing protein [Pseudomonadota bacterium]